MVAYSEAWDNTALSVQRHAASKDDCMAAGGNRDFDYASPTLPRGTFARSIFDNQLVQLSDRGGASQLIGAAWSDVAAEELQRWVGGPVPGRIPQLSGGVVQAIHRLDTLPGVASRASKAGLKNPDFVIFGTLAHRPIVFAVDAKFSVETARPVQVSAETTGQLFDADEHLTRLLPDPEPGTAYVDGVFLSPDYSLTHAMFRHKIGHRRLMVSPKDVVLATVEPPNLFEGVTDVAMIERLCRIDDLPFDVWTSLLASQYYFRLERAAVGLVADERKPLLGAVNGEETTVDVRARMEAHARGADSAWQMLVEWDREVEVIRRQRQAIHQVIGVPLSNAELRDLSDRLMDERGLTIRPSRNQIRKALGARFLADVLEQVGPVVPPVPDFSAELERITNASRRIGERYSSSMTTVLGGIIDELAARNAP
jgi:hypothetical protein